MTHITRRRRFIQWSQLFISAALIAMLFQFAYLFTLNHQEYRKKDQTELLRELTQFTAYLSSRHINTTSNEIELQQITDDLVSQKSIYKATIYDKFGNAIVDSQSLSEVQAFSPLIQPILNELQIVGFIEIEANTEHLPSQTLPAWLSTVTLELLILLALIAGILLARSLSVKRYRWIHLNQKPSTNENDGQQQRLVLINKLRHSQIKTTSRKGS